MGQFLVLSNQHSSLVALVRNLHTGFVSQQYHVVFDDKYDTIFNSGMSDEKFDVMCNELFESSRDWYSDEEHDGDGNLIYKPPPLDEVWLSEPERRERREALEKQRRRHEVFERGRATESAKQPPVSSDDSPPGLVVSDDELSDDDDDGDPSSGPDSGSEGEIWHADHPSLEVEPEPPDQSIPTVEPESPEIPEAPNIASEGATPPEGANPDIGRDPDGRSRRLKNQPRPRYYCTLGEEQIPTEVRRVRGSRKRQKYRQRMAYLRRKGDSMLRAQGLNGPINRSVGKTDDDLPSIEDILNCPLSNFIHLAANDCGYRGTKKDESS